MPSPASICVGVSYFEHLARGKREEGKGVSGRQVARGGAQARPAGLVRPPDESPFSPRLVPEPSRAEPG